MVVDNIVRISGIKLYRLLGLVLMAALFLTGCQEEATPTPTPEFVLPPPTDTRPVPTPRPTITPIPTATFTPEPTPRPTNPPLPTATTAPTQTPIPQTIILVVSSEDGQPVPGATVRLRQPDRGYASSYLTMADGIARFVGFVFSEEPYLLDVTAPGFRPFSVEMNLTAGLNQLTVELESGVAARIITEVANLRVGPGLSFDIILEVQQGQVFPIINVSVDGLWLQVRTPEGVEGWLFASLVEIEGDLSTINQATAPPTAGASGPAATGTITATETLTGTNGMTTTNAAPTRPARIRFDAQELYDDMLALEIATVQLRGVLDRRTSDRHIECEEYIGYYWQVIAIQTYRNVPADWVRVHTLYLNSANNTLDTNRAVYLQCLEGGGQISSFNFRNARDGVDFSLERLRTGILEAEVLLGISQTAGTPTPTPVETPTPTETPTSEQS